MAKHTGAPWDAVELPGNILIGRYDEDGEYKQPVAYIGIDNLTPEQLEEARANSRLIVASPRLLEAAKRALRALPDKYAIGGLTDLAVSSLIEAISTADPEAFRGGAA